MPLYVCSWDSQPLPHRHLRPKTGLPHPWRPRTHSINVEWLRETLQKNDHLRPWLLSCCTFIWACSRLWVLNHFNEWPKHKPKEKINAESSTRMSFLLLLHVKDNLKTLSQENRFNCLTLFINFVIVCASDHVVEKQPRRGDLLCEMKSFLHGATTGVPTRH